MSDVSEPRPDRSRLGRAAAVVGLLLLVCPVLVPYYVSLGLAAPLWAIVVMLVLWALLFALGIRWFRRRPFAVLLLPLVAAVLWLVVVTAGESWLGWTA